MTEPTNTLLGISGSLRPDASSSLVLKWIQRQFDPLSFRFHLYDALRNIPPFDGAEPVPAPVADLITFVGEASCIIFCSPEYAHGMPGVLKNALDWTVSSDVWTGKPVVVITAAGQGEHAHASLMEVLSTMSAAVQTNVCMIIPFVKSKIDKEGELKDAATINALKRMTGIVALLSGGD